MEKQTNVIKTCPVTGLTLVSDPGWTFTGNAGNFSMDISCVGRSILLIRSRGYARAADVAEGIRFRRQIQEQACPGQSPQVLIFDWTHMQGASHRSRDVFMQSLNTDKRLCGIIFYRPSFVLRMSIKLGTRLSRFDFPVHITDTYSGAMRTALGMCGRDQAGLAGVADEPEETPGDHGPLPKPEPVPNNTLSGYRDELLAFMDALNWEEKGIRANLPERENHPFREVFDALLVIKADLDAVFEERKTLESELVEHRDNLERMIRLRTRELEEEVLQKQHAKNINTTLFEISAAVTVTANLDELYPLIHKYLNRIIPMPNFFIGIYDRHTDTIEVPYCIDQYNDPLTRITDVSYSASLPGQVVLKRMPLLLDREALVAENRENRLFDRVPENWMGVPLISQDRVLGILSTRSYSRSDAFTRKDLEVLISVSNQVALAIERRDALDRLREREEKYRSLVRTTSAGYWQVDENEHTIEVNQALCDMLGYTEEEVLGRSPFDFVDEENRESYLVRVQQARKERERQYEVTFRKRNGSPMRAKIDATSLLDDAGRFLGAFAFISDISDRFMAQQALVRAKEAAEETSRAKSEFLTNISHEIRTPINGIMGMAEILKSTALDDARLRYVDTIETEADALLGIINAILDFSKIEAGRMVLEHIRFDLGRMFREVAETMRIRAEKKGVGLVVDLHPDIPDRLKGDPGRLRQILANLADNAVKFTQEGRITMGCRMDPDAPDTARSNRTCLLFEVIDTGIGIAPEKQSTIFDSFYQADGSTTRKYGGTGLGTTISKQLVELMGGAIGFESRQNQGSRFWFTIAFEVPARSGAAREAGDTRGETHRAPGAPSAQLRVLLAEDYPTNQQIVVNHLTRAGYEVAVAENGARAVELFKAHPFDLILMDIQMPELDGYEATREIREHEDCTSGKEAGRIPIIAITAHAMAGYREKCLAARMDDYMSKPLKKDVLLAMVAKWASGSAKDPEPAAAVVEEPRSGSTGEELVLPMDLDKALAEFDHDTAFLKEVVDEFIAEVVSQIADIRDALSQEDFERVARQGHAVKGGAANLRAGDLARVAKGLETAAKQQDLDGARQWNRKLAKAFERLRSHIDSSDVLGGCN
ncbi:MAG: response regulator [Desulfobacter sp.]